MPKLTGHRNWKARLDNARHILRRAGHDIKDLLNTLPADKTGFSRMVDEVYRNVLKRIASGLYTAAESVVAKDSLDFYFWPGYASALSRSEGKRITMECEITTLPGPIQSGVGYGPSEYCANQASYWFHQLLTTHHDRLSWRPDDRPFIPGGTHSWFYDNELYVTHKNQAYPLDTLIVTADGTMNEPYILGPGSIEVQLDRRCPLEWGSQIALVLNDSRIINSPAVRRGPWPFARDDTAIAPVLDDYAEAIRKSRQLLYSLWLMACFVRCWRRTCSAEIQDAHAAISSIVPTLASRVLPRRDGSDGIDEHVYSFWYTCHLDTVPEQAVPAHHSPDLGTAMFFSSQALTTEYIELVRPWLQSQYMNLRYLETAVELRELGARSVMDMFQHSAALKVEVLMRQLSRPQQEQNAAILNGTLWGLQAEVGLYLERPHNHAREAMLVGAGRSDPLRAYIDQAAYQAVARALTDADRGIAEAARSLTARAGTEQEADSLLETFGGVEVSCDGVSAECRATLRLENFQMMFVRALYPTLYHAFRAAVLDRPNRGAPRVSIRVRGGVLVTEIAVAGEPSGRPSKDEAELGKYGRYFVGSEPTVGPVYVDATKMWVTSFAIPVMAAGGNDESGVRG